MGHRLVSVVRDGRKFVSGRDLFASRPNVYLLPLRPTGHCYAPVAEVRIIKNVFTVKS